MAFPLYAYGAVNSVLFGVYGNVLRGISVGKEPCPFDIYLAGCAGGAGQLLLACPVDVVKCTLQSHLSSTGETLPQPSCFNVFSVLCTQS